MNFYGVQKKCVPEIAKSVFNDLDEEANRKALVDQQKAINLEKADDRNRAIQKEYVEGLHEAF